MAMIDTDFEVFKALTAMRESEDVTYNDVLRDLLGLRRSHQRRVQRGVEGCVFRGVSFPEGTQFRATYKGKTYLAEIKGGAWVDHEGSSHTSPSEAAHAITRTSVNGWRFWKFKRPGDPSWRLLNTLR